MPATTCGTIEIARIFLKGSQAEADRLRSWFQLADSTFDLQLYVSADWRYIAPTRWREQSSLQPFVREVMEKFRHHLHMPRDPTTKRQVCQNQHCAAVECLYYATDDQFKVDAQAFDLVRKPPRYLHNSRADKDGSLASIRGSSHSLQQWCRRSQPRKLRCSELREDGLHGNQLSKLVVAVVSKLGSTLGVNFVAA